jgi:hypothetical protein
MPVVAATNASLSSHGEASTQTCSAGDAVPPQQQLVVNVVLHRCTKVSSSVMHIRVGQASQVRMAANIGAIGSSWHVFVRSPSCAITPASKSLPSTNPHQRYLL